MRTLWKLVKVVAALAVLVPISIIVLAVTLGVFGALAGLAFLALKVALFAFVVWVLFRVVARMLRGSPRPQATTIKELPPVDPHYEAAMRELDRELGGAPRS
jgi:hypothetical protein